MKTLKKTKPLAHSEKGLYNHETGNAHTNQFN